ncbi:MAG: class I SAM-dependent methyltransferase [Myxococcota bacterium]
MCLTCGFAYLESWSDSLAEADALYDYYADLDPADSAARHSPENRVRQQELLDGLKRRVRGRRLLDVGCGDGQLLKTAEEGGWEARGIDLSKPAVELSVAHGLRASKTDFFSTELDGDRFDAIVMSELIEHVPSPQRFLQRAESLLADHGVLYLTTPNFNSLSRRALGPDWSVMHREHIGYFDRASLRKMASDYTGLREIRIETTNITPSTLVAWLRGRTAKTRNGSAASAHRAARQGVDQRLRSIVLKSRILRASKASINRAVSLAGIGDTLVAWYQKQPTP